MLARLVCISNQRFRYVDVSSMCGCGAVHVLGYICVRVHVRVYASRTYARIKYILYVIRYLIRARVRLAHVRTY